MWRKVTLRRNTRIRSMVTKGTHAYAAYNRASGTRLEHLGRKVGTHSNNPAHVSSGR